MMELLFIIMLLAIIAMTAGKTVARIATIALVGSTSWLLSILFFPMSYLEGKELQGLLEMFIITAGISIASMLATGTVMYLKDRK